MRFTTPSILRTGLPTRYWGPLGWLRASRLLPPRSGLERSDFVRWPIASVPRSIGMVAIEGITGPPRDIGKTAPRGVALNRRASQTCPLERVAGCGIIAARRKNSAHHHRPWRATGDSNSGSSGRFVVTRLGRPRKARTSLDPAMQISLFGKLKLANCAIYPGGKPRRVFVYRFVCLAPSVAPPPFPSAVRRIDVFCVGLAALRRWVLHTKFPRHVGFHCCLQ